MVTYSPPGNIDDLAGRPTRAAFLNAWHNHIHKEFKENIDALGSNPLFFSEVDKPATSAAVPVPWNGFPLSLLRGNSTHPAAWAAADVLHSTTSYTPQGAATVTTPYRPQDEYCEWHAYSEGGQIKRVVFTAEGPEYWVLLAGADFDHVVDLYRTFVSPSVQPADLKLQHAINFAGIHLPTGSYNPFNRWNSTDGVMHLTHPANTLGAEINLAAFASVLHKDHNGQRVDDVRRLICCAGYGNANRSSDPSIGFAVNTTCVPLAAGAHPKDTTLANPVGLYMNGLQAGVLTGPGNVPADTWFRFVRGAPGMGLMAVLEAPAGSTFGLDQLFVKGVPLTHGGQVAEAIDMVLYAKVAAHSGAIPALQSCSSDCCMPNGTTPQQIKDINLDQVDSSGSCAAGETRAFPELAPAAPAPGLFEFAKAKFQNSPYKPLRTRLAGD